MNAIIHLDTHIKIFDKLMKTMGFTVLLQKTLTFKNIDLLHHHNKNNLHFQTALEQNLFNFVFGWNMAKVNGRIFMVKMISNQIVYIEAKVVYEPVRY